MRGKGLKLTQARNKWGAPSDPIDTESRRTTITPDTGVLNARVLRLADEMANAGGQSEKVAAGFIKAQVQSGVFKEKANMEFQRDFILWLSGKSPHPRDIARTQWGSQPCYDDPEVRTYLSGFLKKRRDFQLKLEMLKIRQPKGIDQYYLYFKYIVRGHFDKFNEEETFLADWDYFVRAFDQSTDPSLDPSHPNWPKPGWNPTIGKDVQRDGFPPNSTDPNNRPRRTGRGKDDPIYDPYQPSQGYRVIGSATRDVNNGMQTSLDSSSSDSRDSSDVAHSEDPNLQRVAEGIGINSAVAEKAQEDMVKDHSRDASTESFQFQVGKKAAPSFGSPQPELNLGTSQQQPKDKGEKILPDVSNFQFAKGVNVEDVAARVFQDVVTMFGEFTKDNANTLLDNSDLTTQQQAQIWGVWNANYLNDTGQWTPPPEGKGKEEEVPVTSEGGDPISPINVARNLSEDFASPTSFEDKIDEILDKANISLRYAKKSIERGKEIALSEKDTLLKISDDDEFVHYLSSFIDASSSLKEAISKTPEKGEERQKHIAKLREELSADLDFGYNDTAEIFDDIQKKINEIATAKETPPSSDKVDKVERFATLISYRKLLEEDKRNPKRAANLGRKIAELFDYRDPTAVENLSGRNHYKLFIKGYAESLHQAGFIPEMPKHHKTKEAMAKWVVDAMLQYDLQKGGDSN